MIAATKYIIDISDTVQTYLNWFILIGVVAALNK